MKNAYTFHALRDFFLGGYQAVLRNNGREVWRSSSCFFNRSAALRAARSKLSAMRHPG